MDLQDHINEKLYAHIVGRHMTCPATGRVLDVRTAVVLEDADERVLGVLSPEAWADLEPNLRDRVPGLRVIINGKVQQ